MMLSLLSNLKKYKILFQALFALNVTFIGLGVYAFVKYVNSGGDEVFALSLVGVGCLAVGIIFPLWVIAILSKRISALSHNVQEGVADLSVKILRDQDLLRGHDHRTAFFWLDLLLISFETYGRQSKNPLIFWLGECAHLVRHEAVKSIKPPKKRRKPRKTRTKTAA